MNRSGGIAAGVVVFALLAALYAGGYWCCVRPHRLELPSSSLIGESDKGETCYILHNTATGRALGILYAPVFWFESSRPIYTWGEYLERGPHFSHLPTRPVLLRAFATHINPVMIER